MMIANVDATYIVIQQGTGCLICLKGQVTSPKPIGLETHFQHDTLGGKNLWATSLLNCFRK